MRDFKFFFETSLLGLICLISACTSPHTANVNDGTSDRAIVNGVNVPASSILSKQVVMIRNSQTGELCTGAILSDQFILTAAHCTDTDNVDNLSIYFGVQFNANEKFVAGSTPVRSVEDFQVPKFWDSRKDADKNTGDIAVVKFSGGLPPGYFAATRMKNSDSLKNGSQIYLLGYGISDSRNNTGAGNLRLGTAKISDVRYSETEIKLDQSQNRGACDGDAGGPVFTLSNDNLMLWGVISRSLSEGDDNCNKDVAATSAVMYAGWIKETMSSMSAPSF